MKLKKYVIDIYACTTARNCYNPAIKFIKSLASPNKIFEEHLMENMYSDENGVIPNNIEDLPFNISLMDALRYLYNEKPKLLPGKPPELFGHWFFISKKEAEEYLASL